MAGLLGLILDYGHVLSYAQRHAALERMAVTLETGEPELRRAYWAHRPDYDLGLPAAEYWARVGGELGAEDRLTPAAIEALIDLDVWSWTHYREEVWQEAAAFRGRGGRVAVLSNGVSEIMDKVRRERVTGDVFDAVIVSCEVGCAKPDPAIYRLALEPLGTAAAETLFVDDREENLAGAAALGIRTLRFDEHVPVTELVRLL
jgi:putative hydrolase of the HAD superfamily